ncbi:hypothetical protein EV121DRAFT_203414 [Schizophyllum commune]
MLKATGPALFLGIELAVDQIRATIVDESLELVGVESVDFDTELPEYQTQGGIFTTPGNAYTTPVEMWIKGLDTLLQKLHRAYDLGRIKCIGGAAQHAIVWWKSTTIPSLSSLDPHVPLHVHFPAPSFSLPNTPVAQDTSSHQHAVDLEEMAGGPDNLARRVGTCGSDSLVAAQLLRVRQTWPQDVWARTGRLQLASAFLASLICGKWVPMGEADACATGIWVHSANPSANGQGHWDEGILDFVGGSREEGRRVRGWLGDVDVTGGGRRVSNVSRYLVDRYGFDPETTVTPFMPDYLSTYLSLCPSPTDAVLSFGPMDHLLTPAQHYNPTCLYNLFPHPAQDPGEKRRYIAVLSSRNGDVPRALVRDMYTKSWSAFDRLAAIVPPGGSIGLDDKLFSFWNLSYDSHPFQKVKGIYRFEHGIKVTEFRDLRANPRCLIESQVMSFRVRWAKMLATGVLGNRKSNTATPTPTPPPTNSRPISSSLGVTFDPYDHSTLPARILCTGAAANFPSISNLVGDVFNASIFIPTTQVDSAQVAPHRNSPAQGYPSRATIGAAYVARWVWGKQSQWALGASGGLAYEDEIRRLLGKRWVVSGQTPLKTNIGGLPAKALSTGSGSGASTPFGAPRGIGNTVFREEEEDEVLDVDGQPKSPGTPFTLSVPNLFPRLRTQTGSTADTVTSGSSGPTASTAFTTPDLSVGGASGTGPTPLTPVTAMPTADGEQQVGLAKVAEPDLDAFMSYAALVPEFCRLEGLLVKAVA